MKYRAITENHLYGKAYSKGKKAVGKYTVVYILPDRHASLLRRAHPQHKTVNRVGLTVTKKIGGAVTRNRVKRIIREGFRLCDKEFGLRCGFLIVIVAREAAIKAKSSDIKAELILSMRKLGLISEPKKEIATQNKAAK